jgi:ubiquitin conjugation factor E4 B
LLTQLQRGLDPVEVGQVEPAAADGLPVAGAAAAHALKILLFALMPRANPSPAIVYLELTAAEPLSESRPPLALRDATERLLIDRLSLLEPPPGSPTPIAFRRAADEARKISTIRDAALRARLADSIAHLQGLILSYTRIIAGNPDTFPSPPNGAPPSCRVPSFPPRQRR